jgi:hypothetical protein
MKLVLSEAEGSSPYKTDIPDYVHLIGDRFNRLPAILDCTRSLIAGRRL